MQRVNEFSFYELASAIHRLIEVHAPQKYSAIWFKWWSARDVLSSIFKLRPFSVSVSAANELYGAITRVVPEEWDDAIGRFPTDLGAESEIQSFRLQQVKQAAQNFETVLAAECQVMDTYFVSKKGVFSTADLIERAHFQFPEPLRTKVPHHTRGDFDQAGRCIAFDLATAAAFHLLRGTEAVLVDYYAAVVPGPRKAPVKMRNWGVYVGLLKEHGADPKIASLLTFMKE